MKIFKRNILILLFIFFLEIIPSISFGDDRSTIQDFLFHKIEVIRNAIHEIAESDQLMSESEVNDNILEDPVQCILDLKSFLKNRLPIVISAERSLSNLNESTSNNIIHMANKRKLKVGYLQLSNSKIDILKLQFNISIPTMALNEELVANNIKIAEVTSSMNSPRPRDNEDAVESLKNVKVQNLILNGNHPFVDAVTTINNSPLLLSEDLILSKLEANQITIPDNRINKIFLDKMLNITRLKRIKGDKLFKRIKVSELVVDERIQNIPKAKLIEEAQINSSKIMEFEGDINVKNLKVNVINQINLTTLLSEIPTDQMIINGDLIAQDLVSVVNLNTNSITRISVNNFMTTNTDQTITSSVFIKRFFSSGLNATLINGESFSTSSIATTNSANIITAKTNFMDISVTKNLNVDEGSGSARAEEATKNFMEIVKQHVIGTKTTDLFQLYNGRVVIQGSLKINDLLFQSPQSNVFVANFKIFQTLIDHYWMKNLKQTITAPVFTINNDLIASSGVFITELNKHPVDKYLLINEPRQDGTMVIKFEDVEVLGDIKSHKSNPSSLISQLGKISVPRTSLVPVEIKGVLEFRNELVIQNLRALSINDLQLNSLIHKNHQIIVLEAPISVDNLQATNVIIDKDLSINTYNNVDLNKLSSGAIKTSKGIVIDSIILDDFTAVNMTVETFEGKSFENMLTKFEKEFSTQQMRTLSINGDLRITSNVFIQQLNGETIVNELLSSLALLNDDKEVLIIGGMKSFKSDVKVYNLNAKKLNSHSANRLLHRSLSRGDKQTIRENLFVRNLAVDSLHTNGINEHHWNVFVSKKKLKNPLFVNLHLEELTVHDLMTNFTSFDLNLLIQSAKFPKRSNWNYVDVEKETSAILREDSPLYQLFTFAVDRISPQIIFGNVNINTPRFYIKSIIKPDMMVISRTTPVNLYELIHDSVKSYHQHSQKIHGVKTILQGTRLDAVNLFIGEKSSFYTTFVNGIDVKEFNRTIYRGGPLYSYKSFDNLEVGDFEVDGTVNGIYKQEIVTFHHTNLNRVLFDQLEIKELTTYSINGYSLLFFLEFRLKKVSEFEQIVNTTLAIKSIHFDDDVIIPLINDVEIDSCVYSVSDQHQEINPNVIINGKVTFIGPVHISSINDQDFRTNVDNSISRNQGFSTRLLRLQQVELKNGLKISHLINNREIQELLNSGAHSPKLQDLMELISNVKRQEMTVDARSLAKSPKARMLYLDTDRDVDVRYKLMRNEERASEESCGDGIDLIPHPRGLIISQRNNLTFDLTSTQIQAIKLCNDDKLVLKWHVNEQHYNQTINVNDATINIMETLNGRIFMIMKSNDQIISWKLENNVWIEWNQPALSVLKNVHVISLIRAWNNEIYLVTSFTNNQDALIYKLNENNEEFIPIQRISSTTRFDIISSLNLSDSTFLILAQTHSRKIYIYRLHRNARNFVFQQILDEMNEDITNAIVLEINSEPFIVVSEKSGIFCFYQWRGIENWKNKHCGQFENLQHMKSFQYLNKQRIFLSMGLTQNANNALVIHRQGEF